MKRLYIFFLIYLAIINSIKYNIIYDKIKIFFFFKLAFQYIRLQSRIQLTVSKEFKFLLILYIKIYTLFRCSYRIIIIILIIIIFSKFQSTLFSI